MARRRYWSRMENALRFVSFARQAFVRESREHAQADLADASLVLIGGRLGGTDIATVDTADFSFYRTRNGRAFHNVFPTY